MFWLNRVGLRREIVRREILKFGDVWWWCGRDWWVLCGVLKCSAV